MLLLIFISEFLSVARISLGEWIKISYFFHIKNKLIVAVILHPFFIVFFGYFRSASIFGDGIKWSWDFISIGWVSIVLDFVVRVERRVTLIFLVTIDAFPFDVILLVCYDVVRVVVVKRITVDRMGGLVM